MGYYPYILSLHLISVITWVLLSVYIQRLIYFQVDTKNGALLKEAWFIYTRFANPAFLFTIVFGFILIISNKGILESGFWIYIKFFLISLIILIHHLGKIALKQLEKNEYRVSKKQVNIHSISPIILLSCVVILTITKPF